MQLREGRDFGWQDSHREPVIIINQPRLAVNGRAKIPGRRAQGIGQSDTRVVGVVSECARAASRMPGALEAYVPVTQAEPEGAEPVAHKTFYDVLAASVMSTLRSVNPGQAATEFRPIQQIVDHAISPRRFFVLLVAAFAAVGLILASLGIYGVISYSVTRQTQEIGIRMALGATMARVQLDVIARTLRLALLGIVVGVLGSLAVAKAIAPLLFGTEPTDPATFAGMILLLGVAEHAAGHSGAASVPHPFDDCSAHPLRRSAQTRRPVPS